jgi:hypothetical protein
MGSRERARWWKARVAELRPLVWQADPWAFRATGTPDDEYDGLVLALLSRLAKGEGESGVRAVLLETDPYGDAEVNWTPALQAFADELAQWFMAAPVAPDRDGPTAT